MTVTSADGGALAVSGLTAAQIGAVAAAAGITVLDSPRSRRRWKTPSST